jgi:hypothetical protein
MYASARTIDNRDPSNSKNANLSMNTKYSRDASHSSNSGPVNGRNTVP